MTIIGLLLIVLMFFLPLSLNLIISLICIIVFRNNKLMRILFSIMFSMSMAFIAFSFEPSSSFDLYRLFEKASWLKDTSLANVLTIYSGNIEILFNLILYFLVINFNIHFIPAFFTFIGYFLLVWMICDYCNKKNAKSYVCFFSIVFFFLSFNHILLISGIRNFIAIIIFVFLLYLEKINNKESLVTHLLYIPLIFLHKSMILFAIIRLALLLNSKKNIKIAVIFSVIICILPNVLLAIFSNLLPNSIFSSFFLSLNSYINSTRMTSTLIIISMILLYLLTIRMVYYNIKHNQLNKFYEFIIIILILIAGVFRYYVLFDRLMFVCICLFPIIVVDYLTNLSVIRSIKIQNKFICIGLIFIITSFMFRNQIHDYWNYINPVVPAFNNTTAIDFIKEVVKK